MSALASVLRTSEMIGSGLRYANPILVLKAANYSTDNIFIFCPHEARGTNIAKVK